MPPPPLPLTAAEHQLSCSPAATHAAAWRLCRQQPGVACSDLVKKLVPAEPFHPSMLVRGRAVPDAWPGGLPPALWRWDAEKISRQQFQALRRDPLVKVGSAAWQ